MAIISKSMISLVHPEEDSIFSIHCELFNRSVLMLMILSLSYICYTKFSASLSLASDSSMSPVSQSMVVSK